MNRTPPSLNHLTLGSPYPEETPVVNYSYVGDDYPLEYPVGDLLVEPVAMTLHETVHYPLNTSDPLSDTEWRSLAIRPHGFGTPRLGPDHRMFVVTFFHQLHCIWKFHYTLLTPGHPGSSPDHDYHCLNYLRQTFMCESAESLELGDFMERDFEKERIGDTLVCKDWQKLYENLERDDKEWSAWAAQWN
ncbi:uncharacterized protein FIBRA_08411 [Fibroporia radiculosa]|uniref:Uncharacterized protein n=1 Tax=Fibroporia radiculosa TaxID=599839 RepID=J4GWR6_9APHY|nr:uncharacterized protein FIBRA_08411 [Fibroporia radiculosa]CCM06170.1 predicted protein [Fibroporia radiculosa]